MRMHPRPPHLTESDKDEFDDEKKKARENTLQNLAGYIIVIGVINAIGFILQVFAPESCPCSNWLCSGESDFPAVDSITDVVVKFHLISFVEECSEIVLTSLVMANATFIIQSFITIYRQSSNGELNDISLLFNNILAFGKTPQITK